MSAGNRKNFDRSHRSFDQLDSVPRYGDGPQPRYGDSPQPSYSAPRRPERRDDEGRAVTGTVKWFNETKGYGFIEIAGENQDAFIHISVIERSGFDAPLPGATIRCHIVDGEKTSVSSVQAVEGGSAQVAARPTRDAAPARNTGRQNEPAVEETVEATVKFFNATKGFGFLTAPNYDIFLHVKVLQRAGIDDVEPGDTFRVGVGSSDRGRVAVTVSPL